MSDVFFSPWFFQICDSIGLAKQIAFHSEIVRLGAPRSSSSSSGSCSRVVDGCPPCVVVQDRRALEKRKDKAKEKQAEELSKQKQIEKVAFRSFDLQLQPASPHLLSRSQDLEEQSRLIAASSRPANPPGPDGQFLVLSSSQSEDSDVGEKGEKRGESEA